jgi:putative tricarboxylic transport membrane protein
MKSVVDRSKAGSRALSLSAVAAAVILATPMAASAAWEPAKPVEWIVPAGSGGGADQMARFVQGLIIKYELMKQPMIVLNKSGGAGAEGFLYMKNAKNDPHKIVITLSNTFTTPLATGIPFNWKDLTPVKMLALDQFLLWVHADTPHKTAAEFIKMVKEAGPNKIRMGGTGSKQEDQIITVAMEAATGAKWTYVPYKGGGEIAVQLVGKHINSSVNNPLEAVSQWRAGQLQPLCIFDAQRSTYKEKVTATMSWADVPTCTEAGVPVTYQMLRGVFTTPGASKDVVDYYVNLFGKVAETPEWKQFMQTGAFNQTTMTGPEFTKWLTDAEATHKSLMEKAGFMPK